MFKKKKKIESSPQPPPSFVKLSDIHKATKNFEKSLLIRIGAVGDVYRGELFDGAIYVRAIFKRFAYPNGGPTDSWPEVEEQRLYTLRHQNLVSLIGYCKHEDDLYGKKTILVYEYISGENTLKDHLYKLGSHLSWIRRLEICLGAAHGLQYLHTAGVLHGDIRSSNILMTESLVPKITDYGFSEVRQIDCPTLARIPSGACGYVDSSFSFYGGLTMKSDVYSLAAVLLELLCGRPIVAGSLPNRCLVAWFQFHVESLRDFEGLIDPKVKDDISTKCLEDIFQLLKRCFDETPAQRPDMAELVASLESLLTLEKRLNNPGPGQCAPSVKELTFDDLKKATREFSQNPHLGDKEHLKKVFLGWVEQETLAPSEEGAGIAVAAVVKSIAHDDWLEEVNFLGQLVHPNIIKLLGYCSRDEHENFLVYEHMQRSLPSFLRGDDGLEPLSWETRLNILIGVARGMAYLYTDKGVLCNFECDDILLDEDLNAKLGGFGWVEVQQRHDTEQLKGVFGYLKADYDPDSGHLPMNDVFSFGLVVLETIAAKHPDDVVMALEVGAPKSRSNEKKLKKIMDPRLQGNYPSKGAFSCMALALRCISVQHECKPSWEEIARSLEQINALRKQRKEVESPFLSRIRYLACM